MRSCGRRAMKERSGRVAHDFFHARREIEHERDVETAGGDPLFPDLHDRIRQRDNDGCERRPDQRHRQAPYGGRAEPRQHRSGSDPGIAAPANQHPQQQRSRQQRQEPERLGPQQDQVVHAPRRTIV
jgi:hypothetical protein